MKILFVAPRFHTNYCQMVKTLKEKGHTINFHVANCGFTEDYSYIKPVRYNQSKLSLLFERHFGKRKKNFPNYFPNPVTYWKAIKNIEPDLVIIRDPFKVFSILAAIFALLLRAKIIFYTQEALYRYRSKKTKIKQTGIMRLFKAAWITPIIGREGEGKDKLNNMYYIPLPICLKSTSCYKRDFTQELKLLMVGKYHQDRKNHLLLIQAVNTLKWKHKFLLTIIGECIGEQQVKRYIQLSETIQELGLSNIIYLRKNVPFSEMDEIYASHHIFVLPAKEEPFGVSVLEALGCGLPAICTDTNGAQYNIRNGENGYVIKSNSLQELTETLEKLVSDKKRVKQMSESSFNYAQNNLSGEVFYLKFAQLMKQHFKLDLMDESSSN